MIDGRPIVAVAIGLRKKSRNRKTGDLIQIYIMLDGVNPINAAQQGLDVSVCGDCKHRPANMGSCYVTLVHGPNSVYKALLRGNYPTATLDEMPGLAAGRIVRLGTYGDPMAVPVAVWTSFLALAIGHTGYTHQWANTAIDASQRRAILALVMASVDSELEAGQARQLGYRYFRVRNEADSLLPREVICPASKEASYRRTCETCKACNGGDGSKASIVINVHGASMKRFALTAVA
jgi:hypothetical protein